ncbi:PspA/IM30 family protein [Desulfoprunum benzoelyticum]|uniref:Phage shock protein A n=1 Tax=Desulfoprunum benzoelyticum TaxID=1506996 RepID=A0A840V854_9BACT|nr:PspA/IM30 family protein [Desulfoprunum benzoelyticum]MBB5349161.1 phage shock protein A [Desulfoprunum benzoelyticum]MBM9530602.1 PspA/IM30 family protein [Desulfoprunum benzoelyticum]
MGVFTRFRDIVSSNINAMLDRAEDPEKMIKLMIREMEDTLVELKVSCAGVIAGRKKAERRLDEVAAREQMWAERAALAVRRGKDDLAREALLEKRRFTEMAEALRGEIVDHGGLIEQYQHDMVELEDKLAAAKEKRSMLVQRHRRATGKKRAQEDIRRMDSSESMARFEKLESRIEQMEAEADLVNFGRKPDVDSQFDDLGRDDEIEKELEKIKAGTYSADTKPAQ